MKRDETRELWAELAAELESPFREFAEAIANHAENNFEWFHRLAHFAEMTARYLGLLVLGQRNVGAR